MTFVDKTVAIALDCLPGMIPFAMIDGETIEHLVIVTERSDTAMHLGRRLVRERASACKEYVIAVDTYLRIDGTRHDAVMFEHGRRDSDTAELFARLYTDRAWIDEAVPMGTRPTALRDHDPLDFHWGDSITPDLANTERKLAVHVVGHALESDANVTRTIRFVTARMARHARALPSDMQQIVAIDDRGQRISAANRERLRAAFPQVDFETER